MSMNEKTTLLKKVTTTVTEEIIGEVEKPALKFWTGLVLKVRDNSYLREVGTCDKGNVWDRNGGKWENLYGSPVVVVSEPVDITMAADRILGPHKVKMVKAYSPSRNKAYWILVGSEYGRVYHPEEDDERVKEREE